jgi:hypothetical protein
MCTRQKAKGERKIFLDARAVRRGPLDGRREASWIAELTREDLGRLKVGGVLEGRILEGGRADEEAGWRELGAEWDWEWEPEGASRKFLMGLRSLRALPLEL